MRPIFRLALALLLASLLFLSVMPKESSASPYKIEGYLKDGQGNPITLANITISGERYDTMTGVYTPTTVYEETNANGYYVVYVWGPNEPDGFPAGSQITISYGSGKDAVSTTVTVAAGLGVWGNLTYKESPDIIDVLSSPAGVLLIVIAVSAIMIGYYITKSHKKDTDEVQPKRVERRRRSK
ncbi:MAG: carboxypeptidase-like regulatory domain-containing protein [Thermoplasmata archaeon]